MQNNWIRKAVAYIPPMAMTLGAPGYIVQTYRLPAGNLRALVYQPLLNGDDVRDVGIRVAGWNLANEESSLEAKASFDGGAHTDWVTAWQGTIAGPGLICLGEPLVIPVEYCGRRDAPYDLFVSVFRGNAVTTSTGVVEAWYQPDDSDDDSNLSPLGNLNRGGVARS